MESAHSGQVALVIGLLATAALAFAISQRVGSDFLADLHGRSTSAGPARQGAGHSIFAGAESDGEREDVKQNVVRDDFTISVGPLEGDHHMRVSVVIKVEDAEARTQLASNVARMRDSFIAKIADRSPDELDGQAGMQLSKQLLLEAVRDTGPGLNVRSMYFSEFFVQ